MKVAKALKLKNRLAAEVARLKGIVQSRNVTQAGQEVVYDVKRIVETDLPEAIRRLVVVKTAIACANALSVPGTEADLIQRCPYWKIFMIAELKGVIETLRATNTRNGKETDVRGYRETAVEVEYVAQVKQSEVDLVISTLEGQIDSMQDDLDAFNASTDLKATDGISVK